MTQRRGVQPLAELVSSAAERLVNASLDAGRNRATSFGHSATTVDSFRNSGIGEPLQTRTLRELIDDPELLRPRPWLIDQLLPIGALILLHGLPKSGKSTMAAAMAGSVAGGVPFAGLLTYPMDVLWLDLERGYRVTTGRLRESFPPVSADRCHVFAGRGIQVHDIAATIRDGNIGLVVVDSISRFMTIDDENAAVEINRAIVPLASLAHELDITVLGIHHDRKAGGSGGAAMRGSGALFAAADMTIQLVRDGALGGTRRRLAIEANIDGVLDTLSLTRTKSGFAPAGASPDLRLERLLGVVGDAPSTADEIAVRLGLTRQAITDLLHSATESGQLLTTGSGRKNNPVRFEIPRVDAARLTSAQALPSCGV